MVTATVSDDAPDPLVGEVVGPYRVDTLLGAGGMGRVYRALDGDGRPVALKLVRGDLARDSVFRRRFEREARIASQIVHPHLVPVLASGEQDGILYLVQRFIPGGSLEDRLRREGRLSIESTLAIASQVASGLAALTAEGMVHRDLKPANILLDERGSALITDFGLAKDRQGTVLTRPGQALGSPHYMAPEQIRGEEVSAATDVYSLGCVVYECLSGAPPFADQRGMRVMWAQLTDLPADPCSELTGAPRALSAAVLLALAKEPSERPASAPHYAYALDVAAGNRAPAGDQPPSRPSSSP
jgi:serine/threonine protein kinase